MTPVPVSSAPECAAPLIVFEGIDGSGKGTQAAALHTFLNQSQISAGLISFPRYRSTFFGQRVGEFLNGDFGTLDVLDPFLISLLYAGDRFESKEHLQQARADHAVVVLDRYIPSNIAHQSARRTGSDRLKLQQWIEQIEYGIYELPQPDLVFLLDIPVETSQQLIRLKQQRTYTDRVTDLQEAETGYLEEVRQTYLQLASSASNWKVIPVVHQSSLRTIDDIQKDIRAQLKEAFPQLAISDGLRSASTLA